MLTDIIVNHGPVTVCMTADNNWQGYVSGVIPSCSNSNSGHCVLLTGASSDGIQYFQSALNPLDATVLNKNFWRFRNSWGTSWGEAGYFRSFRDGSISDSGYCGFCRQGLITLPNWSFITQHIIISSYYDQRVLSSIPKSCLMEKAALRLSTENWSILK